MCACIIAPRRQPRNLFVHGSFWNHKPFAIGSCILAGARMAASTLDSVHNGQPAHECRLNFQVWYQNLHGMLLACWHPGCKRKPVHQNVGQCVLRMLQVLITDRHVCSQTRVLCLLVPVTHPLLFFSLSSALPSHRPVALLHMRVRGRQMAWLIHPGACFRRDGLVPRTRQPLTARGGGPLGPPLRMLPAWVRASPPP